MHSCLHTQNSCPGRKLVKPFMDTSEMRSDTVTQTIPFDIWHSVDRMCACRMACMYDLCVWRLRSNLFSGVQMLLSTFDFLDENLSTTLSARDLRDGKANESTQHTDGRHGDFTLLDALLVSRFVWGWGFVYTCMVFIHMHMNTSTKAAAMATALHKSANAHGICISMWKYEEALQMPLGYCYWPAPCARGSRLKRIRHLSLTCLSVLCQQRGDDPVESLANASAERGPWVYRMRRG